MKTNAFITEIFSSIQGEGSYVGIRQIFIRFAGCNLSCHYCDTEIRSQEFCNTEKFPGLKEFEKFENPVSKNRLLKEVSRLMKIPTTGISLTGGEPLLHAEFLSEFLPELKEKFPETKIYLETNGTLFEELGKIIEYIDIISTDLKLKSSTEEVFPLESHKRFLEVALNYNKEIFAKAVITSKISDEEIEEISNLLNCFEEKILLILQPVDSENKELLLSSNKLQEIQGQFLQKLPDVRVIPQVHKFLGLL